MGVGIASIKRWENGVIQSRSMDKAVRTALKINEYRDDLIKSKDYLTKQIGDNKDPPLTNLLELMKTLMNFYCNKHPVSEYGRRP